MVDIEMTKITPTKGGAYLWSEYGSGRDLSIVYVHSHSNLGTVNGKPINTFSIGGWWSKPLNILAEGGRL